MNSLRINIILPFITTRPNGGVKIMYEYANRLQEKGHRVTVLHSIQRPYRKIKSPLWWKQFTYRVRGLSRPGWFNLHPNIKSLVVPEIIDRYVPDGDVVMCTWWEMSYMISRLAPEKGKRFNLVQDYEVWKGHEELVHRSYQLPVRILVIAKYLQDLIKKHSGTTPVHIPNAIDTGRFFMKVPPADRNPFSILMLYSEEPRKGTLYGLQALRQLKELCPEISVQLFGVYDPPALPSWIRYQKRPSNLPELMNHSAIFFTPSLGEGWALPPAEAMSCGCALVCTDIGGHADYAFENKTALLCKPENTEDMVEKLKQLVTDNSLRLSLAANGHDYIRSTFSWENSVKKMEECFYEAVSETVNSATS